MRRFGSKTGLRRPLGLAAAAVMAGSLLTACGGGSDADLVVYAGRDEALIGPLLEQFEEESGLELEIRYADTPDLVATLLEEGEDSPADVFISQDAGALGLLSAEGLLGELPANITAAVDPRFTSADNTWVGVTGRARVIAYNSEVLDDAEVPDNVAALTDSKWKGRVGFPPGNASFQSFITGFRQAEGDDVVAQWLKDMVANEVQTPENNNDTLLAINEGTIDLGLINHYYVFKLRAEIGEENVKVQLRFPKAGDPGALVNVSGAAVLNDRPAGKRLLEYLVSQDAQEYFVENTYEYPLIDGVQAPAGLPALDSIRGPIEDLADLADLETSIEMIRDAGLS